MYGPIGILQYLVYFVNLKTDKIHVANVTNLYAFSTQVRMYLAGEMPITCLKYREK